MKTPELARLGVAVLGERGKRSYDTSIELWLSKIRASKGIKTALEALSIGLLATSQFDRASAGELFAFLRQAVRRITAVGYPKGGWKPVLDVLLETTRVSPGCEVRFEASMEGIIAPNNRVEAVVASGQTIETGAVVCAFPPQVLADRVRVEPSLPGAYRNRLSSLEESLGLCIEMGLETPLTNDRRMVFAVEPPALVWAISNVSPEVAPPGKQLLQFFSPVTGKQKDDRGFLRKRVDELLDLASRIFGQSPREEWRRVMVTTIGAVVPFTGQSGPRRPGIEVPGYSGLFLIGDGVSSAGLGGDLAARSALDAEPIITEVLRR